MTAASAGDGTSELVAVPAGEGTGLESPAGRITVKLDTGQSNGTLSVLKFRCAARSGPALHTHLREDELWYVLDGEFVFQAGDTMRRASSGDMVFGPRGVPHTFQNLGDEPGRLLVVTTPSGLERYFEDLAGHLPGPIDASTVATVARAHGIEIVGPPLEVVEPTTGTSARLSTDRSP